jgi:hypothetical protein
MATHKHALALARRRLWRCARRVRGVRCMICAHASAAAVSRVRDTLPLRQWFSSTPARWGCGSCAGQEHIFTVVAEPLLSDVLEGYNSTILAYGQVPASRVPQTVPNTTPPHKPIYSLSFSKTQLRHPQPPSPHAPVHPAVVRRISCAASGESLRCAATVARHSASRCAALPLCGSAAVRLCRPPSQVRKPAGWEGHRGLCK